MLARCARCQGTFQADRFGVQTCPHCGAQVLLSDPNAQPGAAPEAPPPAPPARPVEPPPPLPPPPPASSPPAWGAPPPPHQPPPGFGPPPGGYGPPPGGFGPPPPYGPGPAGAGGPEEPAPFVERARLGFFRSYLETWKLAAIEPSAFFRRVRVDQPGSAVLFGVLSSTVGTLAQTLWASLTVASTKAQMAEMAAKLPPQLSGFAKILTEAAERATQRSSLAGQALLAPLSAVVGLFVAAAVFHVLLLLVRGAHRGFNATLTVVGYAMGLSLLQVIPECGAMVVPFWMAVVLIIGFAEAHRCGTGKGAAAVLLPLLLVCACACGVALVAAGAAGAFGHGAGGGASF